MDMATGMLLVAIVVDTPVFSLFVAKPRMGFFKGERFKYEMIVTTSSLALFERKALYAVAT